MTAITSGDIPVNELPMFVTPSVLNSYYDIFTNDGMNMTSQSIFAAGTNGMSAGDLTSFQLYFNLTVQSIANDINGFIAETTCDPQLFSCTEGNLDSQYIMGIAQNVPTTFWHNPPTGEVWNSWVLYLEDNPNPPLVNSASYSSEEEFVAISTFDTFNTEAMKLGLRGITLLAASGDQGVTGFNNTVAGCGYQPMFPASNPYVVAVGATQGEKEVACQGNMYALITTGGGFSSYFTQPSYQKNNVQQYFTETSPYSNPALPHQSFNRSNRGYPDVSAQGALYSIVSGLTHLDIGVAGTSASTPVTAAMFSLINAARKAAGQSPLGFVHPLLYSQSGAFVNDIVSGNNSCLEYSGEGKLALCCPVQGYTAQTGWDPVTGLGSINFKKFYSVAVNSQQGDDDIDSSSNSNVKAGKHAAVGISIAVIAIMFVGSLFFVLEINLPIPGFRK
jgi:tripeptidyl-peptidase-1